MKSFLHGRDIDRMVQRPRGWSNRQAREGRIPHIRLPDGQIRFDPDAIDNWLVTLGTASVQRREAQSAN